MAAAAGGLIDLLTRLEEKGRGVKTRAEGLRRLENEGIWRREDGGGRR